MVHVIPDIVIMFRNRIVERTVGGRTVIQLVPVKHNIWRSAEGMVVYHVQDHRYTVLVAGIDKFLEVVFWTILFIHCKIIAGVVSPAAVSFKFVYGHKLNGID